MRVFTFFMLALISASFAEITCEDARKQFVAAIPDQITKTCRVLGAIPDRRDIMGFFIEFIDSSRGVILYMKEDIPRLYTDEFFVRRLKCIEDELFVWQSMTSEMIAAKLLSITFCDFPD